jgi:geranylgeranylglycerol-phosphate geranylgeranyltransferase
MPYLIIIRPLNCLFVAFSVFFGAFYYNSFGNFTTVLFAMISAFIIAGAGYVINDFFDLPIDSVNKPERVLPSGMISPKTAYIFSLILFILGIAISFFTQNIYCIFIAIFNSILLFLYARFFKMSFLTGNFIVAFAAGSTFIYGGLSGQNLINSVIIALFAFLYTLIREFIKDGEDIEGDSNAGANTMAVLYGRKNSVLASILPILGIIVFTFYIFRLKLISLTAFIFMNILISVPLVVCIIFLLLSLKKRNFSKISSFMKLDMFMLLIILWVG